MIIQESYYPMTNDDHSYGFKQLVNQVIVCYCNIPLLSHYFNGHATETDLLEVPTVYKSYFSGLCKGMSPQNRCYMVQYLHFRILKFPLIF